MKHELQRIISGKGQVRNGADIQVAACYLKGSQRTSNLAKESNLYKKQETEVLKDYIKVKIDFCICVHGRCFFIQRYRDSFGDRNILSLSFQQSGF